MLKVAKIFTTGRSQAVRLPKEFRFEGVEVYIHKEGENVILSPKPQSWDDFFDATERPSADFMTDREELVLEDRGALFE